MSSKGRSGWGAISALFVKPDEVIEEPVVPSEPEEAEPAPMTLPPRRVRPTPASVLGTPASPGLVDMVDGGSSEIAEGRPFEALYAEASVPVSPYPVEKLLSFVAGVSALPEAQIRMCVSSLDASDDTWTIDDPVTDARNKIVVLKAEKDRLAQQATDIEAQGKADVVAADAALAEEAASIKSQIDALQVKLHETMDATSARKAEIDVAVRAAKGAAARETLRLDSEIGRLNRVPNTFGSIPSATPAGR